MSYETIEVKPVTAAIGAEILASIWPAARQPAVPGGARCADGASGAEVTAGSGFPGSLPGLLNKSGR